MRYERFKCYESVVYFELFYSFAPSVTGMVAYTVVQIFVSGGKGNYYESRSIQKYCFRCEKKFILLRFETPVIYEIAISTTFTQTVNDNLWLFHMTIKIEIINI